jgi:hypothetical protein
MQSLPHASPKRGHRANAVLDLREVVIVFRGRKVSASEKIELV